jgi:hypothetical protein
MGCHQSHYKDLTGKRFGRLIAQWPVGMRNNFVIYWLCSCECGNLKVVKGGSLRIGATRSCGCLRKTFHIVHGHTKFGGPSTSEYGTWQHIIQRCTNPKNKAWKWYGGRGIKVCRRWLRFSNFLADMGLKPEPKSAYSIERINNDGNYELKNCKWATREEQRKNQRNGGGSEGPLSAAHRKKISEGLKRAYADGRR